MAALALATERQTSNVLLSAPLYDVRGLFLERGLYRKRHTRSILLSQLIASPTKENRGR